MVLGVVITLLATASVLVLGGYSKTFQEKVCTSHNSQCHDSVPTGINTLDGEPLTCIPNQMSDPISEMESKQVCKPTFHSVVHPFWNMRVIEFTQFVRGQSQT